MLMIKVIIYTSNQLLLIVTALKRALHLLLILFFSELSQAILALFWSRLFHRTRLLFFFTSFVTVVLGD